MADRPYKVVPYEMGAADVIDRATGETVGYVLAAFTGWEAMTIANRGKALVFGTFERHGHTFDQLTTKYRPDAAERVWQEVTTHRAAHVEEGQA